MATVYKYFGQESSGSDLCAAVPIHVAGKKLNKRSVVNAAWKSQQLFHLSTIPLLDSFTTPYIPIIIFLRFGYRLRPRPDALISPIRA
jgi:hypothetical protein